MAGEQFSDAQVANMVRMLMRDQLDHEMVCVVARDRINSLSASLASAEERAAKAEEAAESYKIGMTLNSEEAHHWGCKYADLAATVAGLRGALEEIRDVMAMEGETIWVNADGDGWQVSSGDPSDEDEEWTPAKLHAALAAIPAEHAARIQAAALRSMGDYLSHVSREVKEDDHHEYALWSGLAAAAQHCYSEADRLEKAVGK